MNLRDEWRERVAEVLPCTPRCYPATRSGHSNGCTRSRHTTADQLLAPGGVVAGIVAEALREAADRYLTVAAQAVRGAYDEPEQLSDNLIAVARSLKALVDADRANARALDAPISTPVRRSEPLSGSGEGAGTSDGAAGAERGEG